MITLSQYEVLSTCQNLLAYLYNITKDEELKKGVSKEIKNVRTLKLKYLYRNKSLSGD